MSFLLLFVSAKMDSIVKQCSAQPSIGRKPFWLGESFLSSTSHVASRWAKIAAKICILSIAAIFLQFCRRLSSPFLYNRMVLLFFQESRILPLSRHVLWEAQLFRLHCTPSGPGADWKGRRRSWVSTSASIMGYIRSSSPGESSDCSSSNQFGVGPLRWTVVLVKIVLKYLRCYFTLPIFLFEKGSHVLLLVRSITSLSFTSFTGPFSSMTGLLPLPGSRMAIG